MPVIVASGRGQIKDPALPKYVLPRHFDISPERLEAARVENARLRDEMLAAQKACAANKDRDGARFFKEEAADAMKAYRAACILLPWYSQETRGDCPLRDLYEIGPELFSWLERLENQCQVADGEASP